LATLGFRAGELDFDENFLPGSNDVTRGLFSSDPLRSISILETRNYMGNMLLRDSDVFSMAHGLEIRVPFLDRPLIDVLFSLPDRIRIPTRRSNKPLLTAALAGRLVGLVLVVVRVVAAAASTAHGVEELFRRDDGTTGAPARVLHATVGRHDDAPRAGRARQPLEHVVGGLGRAREDHGDLSLGGRCSSGRAVENDREVLARGARDTGQEMEQRRPAGLEALRLTRPQIGIASQDVVAVEEPAAQWVMTNVSEPSGLAFSSRYTLTRQVPKRW
jgi:hypothetical protein